MTRYEYRLLDVFADRAFGGNQLAVFPDGRAIEDETMQRIARELQLSETTYVLPPTSGAADYRVRIFTPVRELPFAGHPTLGTAFVLADGRDVTIRLLRESFGQMIQLVPTFTPAAVTRARLAEALSLREDDLRADLPLEVGSSGVPFLFAPIRDMAAVRRARPRADVVSESVYLFSLAGTTAHGRMFGNSVGIAEDAASGSAQGPLGAYLVRHGLVPSAPTVRIRSEQGFEMGRPSILDIEVDMRGEAIREVRVGGRCVAMGGGWFDL